MFPISGIIRSKIDTIQPNFFFVYYEPYSNNPKSIYYSFPYLTLIKSGLPLPKIPRGKPIKLCVALNPMRATHNFLKDTSKQTKGHAQTIALPKPFG